MKESLYKSKTAKLSKGEEAMSGIIGGTMACWNHPFEVARIEMQSRADQNQPKVRERESGSVSLHTVVHVPCSHSFGPFSSPPGRSACVVVCGVSRCAHLLSRPGG
jgi:hypothetical protein